MSGSGAVCELIQDNLQTMSSALIKLTYKLSLESNPFELSSNELRAVSEKPEGELCEPWVTPRKGPSRVAATEMRPKTKGKRVGHPLRARNISGFVTPGSQTRPGLNSDRCSAGGGPLPSPTFLRLVSRLASESLSNWSRYKLSVISRHAPHMR